MNLAFDLESIRAVEFGVGTDNVEGRTFCCVASDQNVQQALVDMLTTTCAKLSELTPEPTRYDPAEKHDGQEYLFLPLHDELAHAMAELHAAENLPLDNVALEDPSDVFAYFARFTDGQGRKITALRRATQFKGTLKSRLIQFLTDALKLVEEKTFKLDMDFDLLIDERNIHVLRPKGFEFAGQLQEAVKAAAPKNVERLRMNLKFVAFDNIADYAVKHPRAARYLASICATQQTQNIDKNRLKQLCNRTGVSFREQDGSLYIDEKCILGFLEVLDRRRYELELIDGKPEHYRAKSRQRIEPTQGSQS